MESPYAHASPRSAPTLRRAATAAAVNQRLNPRLADGRPIEYRRADGRREHPHESDADNWVPPPPPYQKEDPGGLPAFLRGPAIKPMNAPPVPPLPSMPVVAGADRGLGPRTLPGHVALGEGLRSPGSPSIRAAHHQRTASDSTTLSRPRTDDAPRPKSSPSAHVDMDDLYDVSPPRSPRIGSSAQPLQTGAQGPSSSTALPVDPSHPRSSQNSQAPPSEATQSPTSPSIDTRSERPTLSVHVPETSAGQPGNRRLSNTQTWPGPPGQDPIHTVGPAPSYHLSAPYLSTSTGDVSLPPAPSSGQVASLNHRISQGNPRRLSGGFQGPNSAYAAYKRESSSPEQIRPVTAGPLNTWSSVPDQPLIISTPKGITGAYDPPGRRASRRRSEMPIVAPVPRHHGSGAPPTVERLETIYSTGHQNQRPKTRLGSGLLAPWRRSPSVSPGAVPVGVSRQTSRAGRSAAKNMKDARLRGWDPQKSRRKKKDYEAASSAGWTDVSTSSALKDNLKDKKCTVM